MWGCGPNSDLCFYVILDYHIDINMSIFNLHLKHAQKLFKITISTLTPKTSTESIPVGVTIN